MRNSGVFDGRRSGENPHARTPYLTSAREPRRAGGNLTENGGFDGLAKGNVGYGAERCGANETCQKNPRFLFYTVKKMHSAAEKYHQNRPLTDCPAAVFTGIERFFVAETQAPLTSPFY